MAVMKTKLLIDGDIIAFTAASAVQKIHEDSFGFVQPFANRAEGEAVCDNMIYGLQTLLGSKDYEVILSDPKDNWRFEVYAGYKRSRVEPFAGAVRPLLLSTLKQYLREKYGAYHWDGLEADDVLGILSTEPQTEEKRIICGRDKDMKTLPGFYYKLKDNTPSGKPIIKETTPWEATRFHMYQTLKGDMTDGVPGCPNIGDTRAEALLDDPCIVVPQKGVITVGKNKGKETIKWVSEPTRDFWAMIVSHYRKGGQGEEQALMNARCVNILQWDQYDQATGEITLWTPEKLKGL